MYISGGNNGYTQIQQIQSIDQFIVLSNYNRNGNGINRLFSVEKIKHKMEKSEVEK